MVLENEPENMHSELLNGISNFEIQNYPEAEGLFCQKLLPIIITFILITPNGTLLYATSETDEKQKAVEQLAIIRKIKNHLQERSKKNYEKPEINKLTGKKCLILSDIVREKLANPDKYAKMQEK